MIALDRISDVRLPLAVPCLRPAFRLKLTSYAANGKTIKETHALNPLLKRLSETKADDVLRNVYPP